MKLLSKTLVRAVTALVPFGGLRRRLRRDWAERCQRAWLERTVPKVRARYAAHEAACRAKWARGERIRVGFVVCDAAMFSAESVYRAMRGDARYAPFIAVVPRVSRGEDFLRKTLSKTLEQLSARYGADVESFYDPDTRAEKPLEGRVDVVFTSVVYDDQTCWRYTALPMSAYALVTGVLYGYGGIFNSSVHRAATLPQLALFWRFFASNRMVAETFSAVNPFFAENLRLGGYPKMDRLAEVPVRAARPKTVLICPHHTLARGDGVMLALSNFLKYADFFLRLPTLFPDVRFVFRPHPLLFPRLATDAWWGRARTDAYRAALEALPNVEFQQGGDYFDVFVNSDAMVHDCGSFLAEYFYVGKPQCFLVENPAALAAQLTPLGERLQRHVAQAGSEEEIVEFVRGVVEGRVVQDAAAREFAAREICIAHPRATQLVLGEIEKAFSRGGAA